MLEDAYFEMLQNADLKTFEDAYFVQATDMDSSDNASLPLPEDDNGNYWKCELLSKHEGQQVFID